MSLSPDQILNLINPDNEGKFEADPHVIKVEVSKSKIKQIMLANGYKEKIQEDQSVDLNPYVYTAAQELILHTASLLLPNVDVENIVVEIIE